MEDGDKEWSFSWGRRGWGLGLAAAIMSRVLVTKTGFGLVIGFINNPQVVTTINSYTVTDLQTLKSLHTNLLSLSAIVFTYL
jgi:hypothetical protein